MNSWDEPCDLCGRRVDPRSMENVELAGTFLGMVCQNCYHGHTDEELAEKITAPERTPQ